MRRLSKLKYMRWYPKLQAPCLPLILLSLVLIASGPAESAPSTHLVIDLDFRDVNGDTTYSWEDNKFSFGDLDGDGKVEFLLQDRTPYTGQVEEYSLNAIDDDGRTVMWSVDQGYSCSLANYDADTSSCWQGMFVAWDFDPSIQGAEVVAAMKIDGTDKLVLLNGRTGEIIRSKTMSKASGTPDRYIQHATAAYLDGSTASIVVQYGIYNDDHLIAYDKNFNEIWRYDPQDYGLPPGGGHNLYPIDVDQPGDPGYGKDDIVHGAYILDHNGKLRFGLGELFPNAPKLHADATYVWDFLKDSGNPGKEALFCIEGSGNGRSSQYEGVFMVNIKNKEIVWSDTGTSDGKNGWDHCHNMFFGEFLSNPGLEIWGQPRAYYIDGVNQWEATGQSQTRIYSVTGEVLKKNVGSGDPIEWDDDDGRTELLRESGIYANHSGNRLRSFPVELDKNDSVQADFGNDGREEAAGFGSDGNFHIYSNQGISFPISWDILDRYYWINRVNVSFGHWNPIPRMDAFGEDPGPPPPTPTPTPPSTFADVPFEHWAHDYIEGLYQGGYISGCSTDPLLYCPEQTLNRAESAVFVERGIHGADHTPPQPPTQTFDDVPLGEWFAKWTTALWEDAYTAGCGTNPLVYCPLQGHTRAEGSVFFLRMMHGTEYDPPEPSGIFGDVPAEMWYADWAEATYNAGLIPACETSPELNFCPDDPLDRAMAAYMLVQAKGLSVP
jgi:hypothetical protein